MENLKLTQFMKKPNKMYIKITKEELDEFFSTGYTKTLKERCNNAYTMFDFKQGILEANHLAVKDEQRHTVDLMMFALAKIEDLQLTISSLEETIQDFEKNFTQRTETEKDISLIQEEKED